MALTCVMGSWLCHGSQKLIGIGQPEVTIFLLFFFFFNFHNYINLTFEYIDIFIHLTWSLSYRYLTQAKSYQIIICIFL